MKAECLMMMMMDLNIEFTGRRVRLRQSDRHAGRHLDLGVCVVSLSRLVNGRYHEAVMTMNVSRLWDVRVVCVWCLLRDIYHSIVVLILSNYHIYRLSIFSNYHFTTLINTKISFIIQKSSLDCWWCNVWSEWTYVCTKPWCKPYLGPAVPVAIIDSVKVLSAVIFCLFCSDARDRRVTRFRYHMFASV